MAYTRFGKIARSLPQPDLGTKPAHSFSEMGVYLANRDARAAITLSDGIG